jgi:hypothetical protein
MAHQLTYNIASIHRTLVMWMVALPELGHDEMLNSGKRRKSIFT